MSSNHLPTFRDNVSVPSWSLKMGPIRCPETALLFLDSLILEDGTVTLSRNVSTLLRLLDPWRWDRYVVPKRRYSSWTPLSLKMGPIRCPETSVLFLDSLILEDGTDTLSRNVGTVLGLLYPWRWDRYVVPKRRYSSWTPLSLKMGPIRCPKRRYSSWTLLSLKMGPIRCTETSLLFLDSLILEDGTDTFSRNVGTLLDSLILEDGTDTFCWNVGTLLGLLDPWRWDRYVVPKRRCSSWTPWSLKMGPIRCPETSVKDYRSTLRNISKRVRISGSADSNPPEHHSREFLLLNIGSKTSDELIAWFSDIPTDMSKV
jgi:hypothetical protein